jgi:hypothetical protein
MYNYFLGGRHNFPADRAAAKRIMAVLPEISDAAWANRGFQQRAARWVAGEQGVRQFLDIGSGLPTAASTHEIVRDVVPGARVVYVDNDPLAALQCGELLAGALIDFTEPVGLLMTAVMHFVAPAADPWGIVARYLGALAPGSYLVLSHGTADRLPPRAVQAVREEYARATGNIFVRPLAKVERFFGGLDLVPPYEAADPGICYVGQWGAVDPGLADSDGSRMLYCGVGRTP